MNKNDITVTLTESQHELLCDVILHAVNSYDVAMPYDAGLFDLPSDHEIVQRRDSLENLREMFNSLWSNRF